MIVCQDFHCPNIDSYTGICQLTACYKTMATQYVTLDTDNMIIFPQTIGDITFYNREELFDWVINQQRISKDPDYGIGKFS